MNMSIDWTEVHKRLATARAALEQGTAPSPDETRKSLKARAQALAREREDDVAAGESIEILEFRLAYENYGIESTFVREVYPLGDFTPLPGTPPFVLGIINVRGQVLSVIDIKKFFELPERGLSDLNKVIIVHSRAMEFGILADAVVGVRSIPVAELQPSLPTLTGIRCEYLKGVTNERLVVLDVEKILSDESIVVNESVGA